MKLLRNLTFFKTNIMNNELPVPNTQFEHPALDGAYRDELTGALNRQGLREIGEPWLAEQRELGFSTAAMFIDLTGFKGVNDSLGYSYGDIALCMAINRLRGEALVTLHGTDRRLSSEVTSALMAEFVGNPRFGEIMERVRAQRQPDRRKIASQQLVARYGGDELMLLVSSSPEDIEKVTQGIVNNLSEVKITQEAVKILEGREHTLRASAGMRVGVSISSADDNRDLQQIIDEALARCDMVKYQEIESKIAQNPSAAFTFQLLSKIQGERVPYAGHVIQLTAEELAGVRSNLKRIYPFDLPQHLDQWLEDEGLPLPTATNKKVR